VEVADQQSLSKILDLLKNFSSYWYIYLQFISIHFSDD
jgi:hypothetical protein